MALDVLCDVKGLPIYQAHQWYLLTLKFAFLHNMLPRICLNLLMSHDVWF
jgi:hypothetical protein